MARTSKKGLRRSLGLPAAIGVFILIVVILGVAARLRQGTTAGSGGTGVGPDADSQASISEAGSDEYFAPDGQKIIPDVDLQATPNIIDHGESVTLFFPESMFDGVDINEEYVETNRFIQAYTSDDGRVAVEMSKERQLEFLFAFKDDVDYNREYFMSELGYLKDIVYTEDMRSAYFFVDSGMDKEILYELPYIFSGFFENYQQMLGQELWVLLTVVDAQTSRPMFCLIFPGGIEIS